MHILSRSSTVCDFDVSGTDKITKILAPMAGYTDIAFRSLAREYGAQLTVTEMVSTRGLVHDGVATKILLRLAASEVPSCVQLFGNDPQDFAFAAKAVECDIIDINMGCPMPKIVKNGDGAALIKNPTLAGDIVRAVKRVTDRPVTVKTRLGYEVGKVTALELIKRVAEAGASSVTVHGRFAEQRYEGKCDLGAVKKLADLSPVPVVPSGDINRDNMEQVISEFGAAMIGRAALGDIGLFSGITVDPTELSRRHIALLTKYFDERYTVNAAKKFFVHYFKSVRGGKLLRSEVNCANTISDVLAALDRFEQSQR